MTKAAKDPLPPTSPRKKRKAQKAGGQQGSPFGKEKKDVLGLVYES
jgi:hypothetical protein